MFPYVESVERPLFYTTRFGKRSPPQESNPEVPESVDNQNGLDFSADGRTSSRFQSLLEGIYNNDVCMIPKPTRNYTKICKLRNHVR